MESESYSYEKIILTKTLDGACIKFEIKKPHFKPINFINKQSLAAILVFLFACLSWVN